MNKYSHDTYIKSYCLTDNEYQLLPNNLKIVYAHKLYAWEIDKVQSMKDTVVTFRGYVKDIYFDYFKFRGFKIKNYDFGTEEYKIIANGKYISYEPTKEDVEELNRILTSFAEVRASFFELNIQDRIETLKKDFYKGNLDLDQSISFKGLDYYLNEELLSDKFTDTERKTIVSAQINCILLNNPILSQEKYEYYRDYIQKCGFKDVEQEKILALFK